MSGLDRKLTDLDRRLKAAVTATGTTVTDIKGVGITTAAMILGEVGDVRRFPSKHHFATYTGTAPLEVFSGEALNKHRLSRAGNGKFNHALYKSRCATPAATSAARRITPESSRPARARRRAALPETTAV